MSVITRTKASVKGLKGNVYAASAEAGGTIEAGMAVYLNGTNGWKAANGSANATLAGLMGVLVSPEDVVDGDKGLSIVIFGRVPGYESMDPGALHFVSDTDGEIDTAAGTKTKHIGYAETAEILFVQPNAPANPAA